MKHLILAASVALGMSSYGQSLAPVPCDSIDLRLDMAAFELDRASNHRVVAVVAPLVCGLFVLANESQRSGLKYDESISWGIAGLGATCFIAINIKASGHDRRAARALRGDR